MSHKAADMTGRAQRRRAERLANLRENWQLYLLLILPVLYFATFKYAPMVNAVIAFKDYSITRSIWESDWVGLKHFHYVVNNPVFGRLIWNTFSLSAYFIIASFPIPIIIAIGINELRLEFTKRALQTVFYAPYFISTVVVVSMTLLILSPRTGLASNLFGLIGVPIPDILSRADYFQHIYVWSEIWTTAGYFSVLYVAALSSIDPSLYEAARIDGATRWQKIWHIDLPGITPVAITVLLLGVGNIMNIGFEKAFLLQNPVNLSRSEILPTYIYKTGLINADYSASTALNIINALISLVTILAVYNLIKFTTGRKIW